MTYIYAESIDRKASTTTTSKMATAINSFTLHWADILILIVYFAVVIGFGIWVSEGKLGSLNSID